MSIEYLWIICGRANLSSLCRVEQGLVKIGRTVSVRSRISNMNTSRPHDPLKLLALVGTFDDVRDEKLAHDYFACVRDAGEFFRTSVENVRAFFDRDIKPRAVLESGYDAERVDHAVAMEMRKNGLVVDGDVAMEDAQPVDAGTLCAMFDSFVRGNLVPGGTGEWITVQEFVDVFVRVEGLPEVKELSIKRTLHRQLKVCL